MSPGPLIVQSDRTVLLETGHPDASDARHELAIFAELERAPEHIHTYRITRLGLWNARAAGHDADFIIDSLTRWSKFELPGSVVSEIRSTIDRFGKLVITRDDEGLILVSDSAAVMAEVSQQEGCRAPRGKNRLRFPYSTLGQRSTQAAASKAGLARRGQRRIHPRDPF